MENPQMRVEKQNVNDGWLKMQPGRSALYYLLALILLPALAACRAPDVPGPAAEPLPSDRSRPNILILLADDLGYSDLGIMGGEIQTPNLDSLARSGKLLSRFYVAPTCSPTRAMLLTGADNHRAGLGTMFGLEAPSQRGQPGYETHLSRHVVTIAALLQDSGYHTYMAGKWHIAKRPAPDLDRLDRYSAADLAAWRNTLPENRGFDEALYILEGGSSHFDNTGIKRKEPRSTFMHNGEPYTLPEDYYSSAFFTDRLIANIERNRASGQPFFAYAAYTAPHWPLHAPDAFIDKYAGVYDVGYRVIRDRRLAQMKRRGLLSEQAQAYAGMPLWPDWDELPARVKASESMKMQVYAGMVDALDHHIGRLIRYLKEIGEYDNTFIVFFSDNGAEGNDPHDLSGNAGWIAEHFDNRLENMGRPGSYITYGPGWARVSSTPFRLHKGFVAEGGIVSPGIVVYPRAVAPERGQGSGQFASVLDIAPTLLELAGARHPGSSYRGRKVFPLQGTSMLAWLTGQQARIHPANYTMGWELFNRRAIRKGDWKLMQLNPPWGSGRWQLFNLAEDPAEQRDRFSSHPHIAQDLTLAWEQYRRENGVILLDELKLGFTNGTDYYRRQ